MSVAAADVPADSPGQAVKNGADQSKLDQAKADSAGKNGAASNPSEQTVEGVDDDERLEVIRQTEFYFSDANLPYDKFMFLQTSPHLDPVKAPNMTVEAKQKAEAYGPGCSPVLLQTVASFKRMRPFTSKYPTSKLVQIIQSSPTEPKLVEIMTQELNGKPTFYIRRILKLEETSRVGASDRCVYVKGFLSEEDLAKDEPADMQTQLERWAKQWGGVAVLRMRRQNGPKEKSANKGNRDKKWKNSAFIEFGEPGSAEKLVSQFKQESGKPQFNGRELSSIMFKIDYVTMKAKEKGLAPPTMSGKRKAGESTSTSNGSFGGNSSLFNAFKELNAIAAGTKQYAGVPASKKVTNEEKSIEYEGNTLSVNEDGSLKNPEELKNFRPDIALGFQLQGEAPSDFKEARVNYSALKKDLTMGDLVCHVVHLASNSSKGTPNQPVSEETEAEKGADHPAPDHSKGTVGFNQSVSDEQMAELQAKGIQSGGRSVTFTRLSDEEIKQYHLDCAILKAKSIYGSKDKNNQRHQKGKQGERSGRGGGRGGRGGNKGHHGGRRGNDRNGEKEAHGQDEAHTADGNKSSAPKAGHKRDAEGNAVSNNGGTTNPSDSVPAIGRAQKKLKT